MLIILTRKVLNYLHDVPGTFHYSMVRTAQGEVYQCSSCKRTYVHKKNLLQHQRLNCGKEPQFPCPLCPYRATQKVSLKKHMLFKHNPASVTGCCPGSENQQCSRCGRRYQRKHNLLQHLNHYCGNIGVKFLLVWSSVNCRCCPGTGNHQCSRCGRRYQHKHNLLQHLNHYCGKGAQFPCPLCDYRATQKGSLKRHMAFKHPGNNDSLLLKKLLL
ncbi:hypothetical protein J6590_014834 [Homalodisca vitripennis]|nr:hypothetical protein J6590_014834 [Homalodisca vitripennis]